jgi:hypothetical protein
MNKKPVQEEAMQKTSNLDGLDLEVSQSISNGFSAFKELNNKKEG